MTSEPPSQPPAEPHDAPSWPPSPPAAGWPLQQPPGYWQGSPPPGYWQGSAPPGYWQGSAPPGAAPQSPQPPAAQPPAAPPEPWNASPAPGPWPPGAPWGAPAFAHPWAQAPYGQPWPPPAGPAPGLRYVGFWLRVVAALIDGLILTGLFVLVSIVATGVARGGTGGAVGAALLVIAALLAWLGTQIYIPGRYGGTLGMRALGIWIVREQDGSQIGYALAAGRFGVFMALNWLTLGLGALADGLLVAFDGRKQSIHDKACSTLVVRHG